MMADMTGMREISVTSTQTLSDDKNRFNYTMILIYIMVVLLRVVFYFNWSTFSDLRGKFYGLLCIGTHWYFDLVNKLQDHCCPRDVVVGGLESILSFLILRVFLIPV